MAATKYDAMIAAMDMLQNITDKPDWKLREEELALRERMHEDEIEMSLLMTQIKNEQSAISTLDEKITNTRNVLGDVKTRILATGDELDKIADYESTEEGLTAVDDLYNDLEPKFGNRLKELERTKREKNEILGELEYRLELRETELGKELGDQAIQDEEYKKRSENREIKRLQNQELMNNQLQKIRIQTEHRPASTYAGLDPASIQDEMNTIYAGMQSLTVEDGALDPSSIKDLADASGGVYAANSDLISSS